jgi:hypothetical protein
MSEPWPYNLPIFRRANRATSPDSRIVAEIEQAFFGRSAGRDEGAVPLGHESHVADSRGAGAVHGGDRGMRFVAWDP